MTTLAIFDLDHTLLNGDSDHGWGEFLIQEKIIIDAKSYAQRNNQFYQDYQAGILDIKAYANFVLAPIARLSKQQCIQLQQQYMTEIIIPMVRQQACNIIEAHRQKGHQLIMITATNRFITQPIAKYFNIDTLLATEPEIINGKYTGLMTGVPCYQQGKVVRLEQWINKNNLTVDTSHAYSDSFNDLPLLQWAKNPYAVTPDSTLKTYALKHNWPILNLS